MKRRAFIALISLLLGLPAAAQQPEAQPSVEAPASGQPTPVQPETPPPDIPARPTGEAQQPAPGQAPKSAPTEAQKSICMLIESAARANGLPVEFFARVIWQESRFQAGAVGPVTRNGQRAQGIAQFMPGTAAERNLLDPMDPVQALPKSAEFLRELRAEFGNLGLAAAAYNAGPRRVRDWIAGRGGIPAETRNYVFSITGSPVDQWSKSGPDADAKQQSGRNCATLVALLKREPSRFYTSLEQRVVLGAMQPWGSIVGADSSRDRILSKYAVLQQRYSGVLSGLDPILIERRRGPLPRFQVRVGAQTRAAANDLCLKMHKEHGDCVVLRNPGG